MKSTEKNEQKHNDLTPEDTRAARNLRAIWNQYQADHPGQTQAKVARKMGWTQGNFSLYLNGHAPIGNKPLKVLSAFFGVEKWQIRPEDESQQWKMSLTDLVRTTEKIGQAIAAGARPNEREIAAMRLAAKRGRSLLRQYRSAARTPNRRHVA